MSTLVNFTAYGDEDQTQPSTADHWVWDFGDGNTATTYTNATTHVYNPDGVFQVTVSAYISADPYDPYVQCVATNIINVCTLFSGSFTYSVSGLSVTVTGSTVGAPAASYSYYYYDFDDSGYAYAVESNTGTAPAVVHGYTSTSATPYTPTLVCKNGGRVVDFGPMAGGEVDFSTGGALIESGTAVGLMGASLNHLTVVSPSDYTVGTDKITLDTGITAGYYLQLLYVDSGSGYNQTSSVYAADVLLPANGLSVGLTPSGIAECFNGGITFVKYVFGGSAPYTYSWNFDSTSELGTSSADDTWVTVAGTEIKTSTSASPGEIIYNANPTASLPVSTIITATLTVTDSALVSSTASAVLTFGELPAVFPSGYENFSRRYISSSSVGALFTRVYSVQLGTSTEADHNYIWTPEDDLDSTVIAQPTCTPTASSRRYLETITKVENGSSCVEYVGCENFAECYVNIPSVTLGAVTLSSSLGTCLKAVSIKINSVSPAAEGLALIVERVRGAAGTVADVGVSGDLPEVIDYTASPTCNFITAGLPGGILMLDTPYRTFNTSNRVAYKITQSTTFPLYITALDPVCSSTTATTHDYRVRLIDVAGILDASVTEAMMVDNSRASLAISNDITLQHTGVESCLSSATINVSPSGHPTNYYYGETITFSTTVSGGVAPLFYNWNFDGLGNFTGGGYSYEFVDGTSATSASPQVRFLSPASAPNKIARIGLTVHDSSNGGAGVDIIAPTTDLTMEYIAPCVVSCSASVPTTAVVSTSVAFAGSAPITGCTSSVTYDWDFGDGTAHSSSQNPSHTYSTPDTYTWVLIATASGPLGVTTCTRSGAIVVSSACVITACGTATESPAPPEVGCYCPWDESVPFIATYSTTGTCGTPTFTWNFGDGNTGSGQSTTHIYTTRNTTFNWTLTVNINGVTCSTNGQVKTCTLAQCDGSIPGCFVAGTLITMADGTLKPIENIQSGDRIIGADASGHVIADVLAPLVHNNYSEFMLLGVSAGPATMIMTSEHKVWIEEKQDYIEVSEAIRGGFTAKLFTGKTYPWALASTGHFADTVYNLTTSTRNYFANGVLVSNMKAVITTPS